VCFDVADQRWVVFRQQQTKYGCSRLSGSGCGGGGEGEIGEGVERMILLVFGVYL